MCVYHVFINILFEKVSGLNLVLTKLNLVPKLFHLLSTILLLQSENIQVSELVIVYILGSFHI